jgi:hypothetical protein
MFTPLRILNLWKRVNDRFGLSKADPKAKGSDKPKVSPKAKLAEKEDTRIQKGLTELRNIAKGDLSAPAIAGKFIQCRDRTSKSMRKCCKLLQGNELKDAVHDLVKLRKAVKQLTVVVEALQAKPYPEEKEGEIDLNQLEGVDTSALDKAMQDPKFGEYSDAELDEPAHEQPHQDQPHPPTAARTQDQPKHDPAATWAARRHEVEQQLLAALKGLHPNATQLRGVFRFATEKAEAGDYAKALQALDNLAKLLNTPTGANGAATPDAAATLQHWQAACTEVKNQIRKVEAEIVKAKHPNSAKAVMRLESILKNLGDDPSTQQDVLELERWIEGDDVITRVEVPNAWGIPVKVREKLLPVLGTLKSQLPA